MPQSRGQYCHRLVYCGHARAVDGLDHKVPLQIAKHDNNASDEPLQLHEFIMAKNNVGYM